MRCESVAPYLAARAANELESHTRGWVDSHVETCERCSAIVARTSAATKAIRMLPVDAIEPPAGLSSAVMARISERESMVAGRKLLPLPFVAGEQIGQIARTLSENKDTLAAAAGAAAVIAGASWLALKAIRSIRSARPQPS